MKKSILLSTLLLSLLGVGFIASCDKNEAKEEPDQQQNEEDKNEEQTPNENDDTSSGGPSLDI